MSLRFFRERVVLALLVMFTASHRSAALYTHSNITGFGHKLTPLQTQHFQVMSVMKLDHCFVERMTKYENFIVVLCTYLDSDDVRRAYIRIYEDQVPFDLLMIIDAEVMQHPLSHSSMFLDMVSSIAAKSIFISHWDVGVWQLRWNYHELKRFPVPGNATSFFRMSVSEQGHLQLFDEYNVFVYDSEGTLIRRMPLYATIVYILHTPIGGYGFQVSLSTLSSDDETLRQGFYLQLREITLDEDSVASDVTESGTTECIDQSLTRSIFLPNIFPVKYPDCELYNFTVSLESRRSEFICSKQAEVELFSPIISVDNNQFDFWFSCSGITTEELCLLPNASDSLEARRERMRKNVGPDEEIKLSWKGSYFFDKHQNQLVLSFSSFVDYHDDLFVLRLK